MTARSPARNLQVPKWTPPLSDWQNFEGWRQAGELDGLQRAAAIVEAALADYVEPPMTASIRESLRDFIERRRREGGASVN
jgi:trimethylamine--corrinoid protein Co-methyltransferase